MFTIRFAEQFQENLVEISLQFIQIAAVYTSFYIKH